MSLSNARRQSTRTLRWFVALTLSLSALCFAQDNTSKRFGDYEVHYSVFNTDFITPQTAKLYNIVRAKDRVLMNIAIRKHLDNGSTIPVAAKVSGSRWDLIHRKPIEFSEVREPKAIYYISEFKIGREERIQFTVEVIPEGERRPLVVKFNKHLYGS